jgi:hypothetical protein
MSASSHAADLFRNCDALREEKSFQTLSKYFVSHPGDHFECLALNRRAFVFTTAVNFEDCRIDEATGILRCSDAAKGTWYPNLDLVASFSGDGKRFALFYSEQLEHGFFGEGYHLFYLVPRHVDDRGYRILQLEDVGAFDQSDASGQCASSDDLQAGEQVSDVVKAGSPPFEILNEGSSDVTIRFNQQIIRCATGQVIDDTVSYRWSRDSFIKVSGK